MLTHVTVRGDYIHVAIACTDANGGAIDPTSAEARFYKVSQTSGALLLDTRIGTGGVLTLVKQADETGFYSASIEVAGLGETQYVLLFKAVIGGTNAIAVDYLHIDEDPHVRGCVANAVYANATDTLTVNVWLTDQGLAVTVPFDCTFTLYDDTGEAVFAALYSAECDANGVFRFTKAAPGLSHDQTYYGKVDIYDDYGIHSGLVGLVTVE